MIILAHRGLWRSKSEQNTLPAIRAAFESGFGVETDIRDCCGALVVSHDPPRAVGALPAAQLFEVFYEREQRPILALNLKADGLKSMLESQIEDKHDQNYFLFDMSLPDTIPYLEAQYRVYTRWSEYEQTPAYLDRSAGVWCDFFLKNWINGSVAEDMLRLGKHYALVSPELHGRPYRETWAEWRDSLGELIRLKRVSICTDRPEEAEIYFNG